MKPKSKLFGVGKEQVELNNEIHKLTSMLEESTAKHLEKDKEIMKRREYCITKKKSNNSVQKNINNAYKEILSLSKVISSLVRGDEPNMGVLLGEYSYDLKKVESKKDWETELTEDQTKELNEALNSIRRNICDYYAERYSNECNLQ